MRHRLINLLNTVAGLNLKYTHENYMLVGLGLATDIHDEADAIVNALKTPTVGMRYIRINKEYPMSDVSVHGKDIEKFNEMRGAIVEITDVTDAWVSLKVQLCPCDAVTGRYTTAKMRFNVLEENEGYLLPIF